MRLVSKLKSSVKTSTPWCVDQTLGISKFSSIKIKTSFLIPSTADEARGGEGRAPGPHPTVSQRAPTAGAGRGGGPHDAKGGRRPAELPATPRVTRRRGGPSLERSAALARSLGPQPVPGPGASRPRGGVDGLESVGAGGLFGPREPYGRRRWLPRPSPEGRLGGRESTAAPWSEARGSGHAEREGT